MTATELRSIRETAKLSRSRFSRILGLSVPLLRKMEFGKAPVELRTQLAVLRFRFIGECETMLDLDRDYRRALTAMDAPGDDAARAFREQMIAVADSRIASFEMQLDRVRNTGDLLRRPQGPVTLPPAPRLTHNRSGPWAGPVERPPVRRFPVARHY